MGPSRQVEAVRGGGRGSGVSGWSFLGRWEVGGWMLDGKQGMTSAAVVLQGRLVVTDL